MEGRRRDAGRERLRASALQRFRHGGMRPSRLQGEALVPVHASAAAEDGGVAARAIPGRQALFAADRSLKIKAGAQRMSAIEDKTFALSGDKTCTWRAEEIMRSAE